MVKLERESSTASIALYLSTALDRFILNQNTNRSEWMREAGEQFLHFIKNNFIDELNHNMEGHKIVSISKPSNTTLNEIYYLVHTKGLMFSRSEFYRMSIFYRIIKDAFQRKHEEKLEKESEDPNIVKIPIDRDKEGNHVFKTYKILKKLNF